MEPRAHYVIVGIFVLLLGTATVGLSLWLAFGDIALEYKTYRIYMRESVAGLFIDAPVKYRGVEIGKVRELALDPDNIEQVRVTVDIDNGVAIREDTIAKLAVQGVTGIASIELSGGSLESPILKAKPGEPYPVIEAGPSLFTRVDAAVSELIGNLNMVAHDLHALLTPESRAHFTSVLKNVDDLTKTVAEQREALGKALESFATFADNAAAASVQLPELVARMDKTIAAYQTLADDVAVTSQVVREQAEVGGGSLQDLGSRTLPEAQQLLTDMRQLIAGFQRLSDRLEEDPRAILYGPQVDRLGPGE